MGKKIKIESVQDIANELLEVRLEKAELMTKDKLLSQALKQHPNFREQDLFIITQAVSVVVKDMEAALEWAEENAPQIITVDVAKAKKLFAAQMSIPTGFESKLTDRLIAKSGEERESDVG